MIKIPFEPPLIVVEGYYGLGSCQAVQTPSRREFPARKSSGFLVVRLDRGCGLRSRSVSRIFFIAVGFEDAGMKITGSNLDIFVTLLYAGVYHWLCMILLVADGL